MASGKAVLGAGMIIGGGAMAMTIGITMIGGNDEDALPPGLGQTALANQGVLGGTSNCSLGGRLDSRHKTIVSSGADKLLTCQGQTRWLWTQFAYGIVTFRTSGSLSLTDRGLHNS